jgi:hypothetical protein
VWKLKGLSFFVGNFLWGKQMFEFLGLSDSLGHIWSNIEIQAKDKVLGCFERSKLHIGLRKCASYQRGLIAKRS